MHSEQHNAHSIVDIDEQSIVDDIEDETALMRSAIVMPNELRMM